MIFPIGDDQIKGGHFPLFSYGFIAINLAVWFAQIGSPDGLMDYAAVPAETARGQDLLTILTSMFMHGSWGHLLGNMLFLWIFADNIEATIGSVRFLFFYLIGGLVAYLTHFYFNQGSSVATVGASGAISAVMGAYLIMFPTSRVKMFFFFFVFRISAWIFLGLWIWQQWMAGMAGLEMGAGSSGGVAVWAHIGGFVFGAAMGLYYRLAFKKPRQLGQQYV